MISITKLILESKDVTSIKFLINLLKNGKHEIYHTATDQDIIYTERKIHKKLPDDFIYFLRHFSNGAYLYNTQEVASVGTSNKKIQPIQNIYNNSNSKIKIYDSGKEIFEKDLIPFGLDSNGNIWCFFKNKVGYFDTYDNLFYPVLSNFKEWLSILIRHKEEVIRVLIKQKKIKNTLNLG